MAIIVLQHSDVDTLGRLGPVLRDLGHKLDVRRPDRGGAGVLPTDYDSVHAVIVMGGPQNVGDDLPWMAPELEYIKGAHARQLPVLGICLGHQMIAAALGGEVTVAATPEFGYCAIHTGVPGQTDTLLAGVPWNATVFQTHAREVSKLPPDATALQSSTDCKVQCFRAGLRTYGFQYHFEVGPDELDAHCKSPSGQAAMAARGLTIESVRRQGADNADIAARVGTRLCDNIAMVMFPMLRHARI